MNSTESQKQRAARRRRKRIWREFRPAIVMIASVLIVYAIARVAVNTFLDTIVNPVDTHDATPIEVTIPSSASASSIARILYGACGPEQDGLIRNTAVFKVYVDFVGKANTMKAGTYVLSKNMSVKQIVDVICEGNPPKATIKFTVPEGYTVRDIFNVLLGKGMAVDEAAFYAACQDGAAFESFAFIRDAAAAADAPEREYTLEGYLFPDTYEVYADAGIDAVLTKMLNRFNEIFTDEYAARAQELNMSIDDVVTLASLIEREARVDTDFAKVSAVFHNRLKQEMALQSCASLSYALKMNKLVFSNEEMATVSPYNTYLNKGLPVGPVCNPGKTAIEAALHPNETFLAEGYLYFCNGNLTESNELVFAKTYEEHQENVETYQKYWS